MSMDVCCGDCLEVMRTMDANSVDLVVGSPPYEAARTYGVGFNLRGQEYVDWCVERFVECVRVSRGLVAWVIEGQTRKFRYSATPLLLMADLHRRGVHLRKPPAFHRVGIPGSGGPDWLRNDYEFIVCATSGGKLPFSDNTAMGHPPRWAPGGAMSYRNSDGVRKNARGYSGKKWGEGGELPETKSGDALRRNQWGGVVGAVASRKANGKRDVHQRPSHVTNGTVKVLANPGNVIKCLVGGGVMGSKLCHENEAPFPEALAEFFVRSFCPPGGTVLDPFSGSGTTGAVALKTGRNYIGIDVRESQVELTKRRLAEVQPELFG